MEERLQVSAVEIPKTNPEKYEDEGMSLVEEKPTQLNEDEKSENTRGTKRVFKEKKANCVARGRGVLLHLYVDKEQASPSKDTARENKEKLVTSQMEVVVNTVVEEQREEVEVEKEDNTALKEGNETVDDANNWARVSPAKVGRSPVRPDQRKYTEDF
ncbi:hypothetical protein DY000_02059913 [Brassica cretica]|uniref:Uncharacterized protein n=2 Tax=Brassica cretica TaxID=69181 RepID=A0ABQ7APA8_BRACR|nr:hypothetical protein DY000_02059913 [Brassica cretica]